MRGVSSDFRKQSSLGDSPLLSEDLYTIFLDVSEEGISRPPPHLVSSFCDSLALHPEAALKALTLAATALERMFPSFDRYDKLEVWIDNLHAYLSAVSSANLLSYLSLNDDLRLASNRLLEMIERNCVAAWRRGGHSTKVSRTSY